jgi:hypothetical protein
VTSYVPHALAVGRDVVGYLPGYLHEESYSSGTRYLIVGLLGLRGAAATVVVAAALLAVGVWSLRTPLPVRDAALRVMVAVLLLVTPVQPWYATLLVALVALTRTWWALPIAAASYPLFFSTVLHDDGALVGRVAYGVALVVAVLLSRVGSGSAVPTPRTGGAPARPAAAPRAAA